MFIVNAYRDDTKTAVGDGKLEKIKAYHRWLIEANDVSLVVSIRKSSRVHSFMATKAFKVRVF